MKQKHSLRVSFAYCLSGEPRRIFHAITVSLASLDGSDARRFSDGLMKQKDGSENLEQLFERS